MRITLEESKKVDRLLEVYGVGRVWLVDTWDQSGEPTIEVRLQPRKVWYVYGGKTVSEALDCAMNAVSVRRKLEQFR